MVSDNSLVGFTMIAAFSSTAWGTCLLNPYSPSASSETGSVAKLLSDEGSDPTLDPWIVLKLNPPSYITGNSNKLPLCFLIKEIIGF